MTFEQESAEKYAQHLLWLAWADGNLVRQKSWWPYVNAEALKLDQQVPGIRQRLIDQLKAKRNEAGNG